VRAVLDYDVLDDEFFDSPAVKVAAALLFAAAFVAALRKCW
jgi:hypothetical protein